jgi:hypothetical protein
LRVNAGLLFATSLWRCTFVPGVERHRTDMKKIEAVIRPIKLDEVKAALQRGM